MLPAAIGALALALRLYGLGSKPFWLDEIASAHRATASIPDLVADSLHNGHYPTYFLLLWLIARVGASQFLLRLPSAIFGAACASLTCMIGRRVGGARSGAVAGLFVALSPFEVQFGQEARPYTLVALLVLTALWGLVRLAQDPAAAAVPLWRRGGLRGAWLAFGLGTAAALAVLNVAVPWLIAANLGAIAIAGGAGEAKRSFWRNWGLVQLAVLAVWVPMFAAVYVARHGALLDAIAWAPATSAKRIWSIVAAVYFLRIAKFITIGLAPVVVPGLPIAVGALAALGLWHLRHDRRLLAVLSCAAFVLPLSLGLVSVFVPLMVPRYFAWGGAPLFVLAGIGFGRLSGVRFAVPAIAAAALGLVNLLPYYGYETKPRWDEAASELATVARPGDMVLLNSYYAKYVLSAFAARAGLHPDQVRLTWSLPDAMQRQPGRDLWVIYGRTGQVMPQSLAEFRKSLAPLGEPLTETPIGRYIVLWHFAEPEHANSGT
ncbi:MAG TPA: glycosyltransferase family 39 protein [Stellaceae bacterium]|nr:glycosyltransferase family 39 protein [Stellaceae bacterium]